MGGWTWMVGFEYVLSNILGLASPLTDAVPITDGGVIFDIIVSAVAYVLSATIIGLAASLSFVLNLIRLTPKHACTPIVLVFMFVPGVLIIIMLVTGGIV